jgi:uncharacterized Zn finger protein
MSWAPYVPVAKRREKALKKKAQLKKKGHSIRPIEIEGRTIAHSFWGKAWCTHMESFCDLDNRLTRGRTYVRNGSVCHLDIKKGEINAMVSGNSVYNVTIQIKPLLQEKWDHIKQTCLGKVSSLLDLLSGTLSDGVMEVVVHPKDGLFPLTQEFSLNCDCPDWASMCKHVAAVLYGVGSRLDTDPAQLFILRGVDFEELIDINEAITSVTSTISSRRKIMDDDSFGDLFGIDMVQTSPSTTPIKKQPSTPSTLPSKLTGESILNKRLEMKCSKKVFAEKVGVSSVTISLWEAKNKNMLNLNSISLNKLKKVWEEDIYP